MSGGVGGVLGGFGRLGGVMWMKEEEVCGCGGGPFLFAEVSFVSPVLCHTSP